MRRPLTADEAVACATPALELAGAEGVEVVMSAGDVGLTRYARSRIIQNTVRAEVRAYVRVVASQGRTATVATNRLDSASLRKAAAQALAAARVSLPDPGFPGLPGPEQTGDVRPFMRWDEDAADATPAHRAGVVADLVKAAGGECAGYYETGGYTFAVVSSPGLRCFDSYTRCVATCLVDIDGATGWAQASAVGPAGVHAGHVAGRARAKAEAGRGAVGADPGVYDVVLEPAAVATLLEYLSYAGMGAKQVAEGESFLSVRLGEMVAAPSVTIADDAGHSESVGIAFDFEGCSRRRVEVIKQGRAMGPVTDLRTARELGLDVTGHYSGSAAFGPYASNVVLEAGNATVESLVARVDDGLLVTRFHYVNILDRPSTLLTGMTRDGTFRIRGGEIAEPVHNFRFSQSVLGALEATEGIGSELESFAPEFGSFGSTAAPAIRVGEFCFSSRTSH